MVLDKWSNEQQDTIYTNKLTLEYYSTYYWIIEYAIVIVVCLTLYTVSTVFPVLGESIQMGPNDPLLPSRRRWTIDRKRTRRRIWEERAINRGKWLVPFV